MFVLYIVYVSPISTGRRDQYTGDTVEDAACLHIIITQTEGWLGGSGAGGCYIWLT